MRLDVHVALLASLCAPQIPEWASLIHNFVKTYGLGDSVMVVDELSSGDDVRGTGELVRTCTCVHDMAQ